MDGKACSTFKGYEHNKMKLASDYLTFYTLSVSLLQGSLKK